MGSGGGKQGSPLGETSFLQTREDNKRSGRQDRFSRWQKSRNAVRKPATAAPYGSNFPISTRMGPSSVSSCWASRIFSMAVGDLV